MRYVIDAGVAIRLAADRMELPAGWALVAPTLLRSQALSLLHEAVGQGALTRADAEEQLDRIRGMRIRLLGDRVLQAVAWKIADQLGWQETYRAEYIALTQLQADRLVTLDADLERAARRFVQTAPIEELYAA